MVKAYFDPIESNRRQPIFQKVFEVAHSLEQLRLRGRLSMGLIGTNKPSRRLRKPNVLRS